LVLVFTKDRILAERQSDRAVESWNNEEKIPKVLRQRFLENLFQRPLIENGLASARSVAPVNVVWRRNDLLRRKDANIFQALKVADEAISMQTSFEAWGKNPLSGEYLRFVHRKIELTEVCSLIR